MGHNDPEAAEQNAAKLECNSKSGEVVLRSILESIPQFVFWKDCELNYLGANSNFARAAGLDRASDIVGMSDFELAWTHEEAEFYRSCDREVMATDKPLLNIEESQLNADGEETLLLTSKVPLHDQNGNVMGILGMFADITDRKRAQDEREQLQQQLLVVSREAGKAEVANGVLHNVGNAMNSIGVRVSQMHEQIGRSPVDTFAKVAETLAPYEDDLAGFVANDPRSSALPALLKKLAESFAQEHQRMKDAIAQLTEQVAHVNSIVSNQQAFARNTTVMEHADIKEIIRKATDMAGGGTLRRDCHLEITIAPEIPEVLMDRNLVVEILVNLLNNGYQARKPEDQQPTLRISAGLCGDQQVLEVSVEDEGVGIESGFLDKVFQHSFTTRTDGHGFGLHRAAVAAQSMGGSLNAASDGLGHGARFTLTLPVVSEMRKAS